jgi:hypothetical protein
MKRARRLHCRSAFDLIEEATQLLRTAPAATLAVYYLGAIPFALGFLFFWADMSRSPFAAQHLSEATFLLSALFLWMKFWQVIFARKVRAQIAAEPLPRWNFRRCARIFLKQATLQPLGLFVLPLALIPVIPFAWVYAFFQNLTALAGDNSNQTARLTKKSWKLATLWPAQNFIILAIMLGFAFCVFLNWATVCLLLPQLAKMLFGISSIFTESPYSALNTTFFSGMAALTYLCVDPILKTIYVLRCFYGESLQSGEDLKAELKPFAVSAQKFAAGIVIVFTLICCAPSIAADTTLPSLPAKSQIAPSDLDQAINQTIHESKYTWRMPRQQIIEDDANEGVFAKFIDQLGKMLRKWARATWDWLQTIWQKLFPRQRTFSNEDKSSGYGWIMSVELLLYALVAAAVAALVIFLFRVWRGRRSPSPAVADAVLPVPDIADENVRADQLPEDGWTKLARELLERGEFRLAMRAFYLASLAHLAARHLIHIARFKSNRDYERELRRRAHSFPNLLSVFDDNIFAFERVWYGMHAADRAGVDQFAVNIEKIKTAG